jgi:hypothetical protein
MNTSITESRRESVKDIIDKFISGEYQIPEFQRDLNIWTIQQKEAYIKNVLNKLTPTSICITKVRADNEDKFCIIDGLQRINALRNFKKGKFKVKLENVEGAMKDGEYCYKSNDINDNQYVLEDSLKSQFDDHELIILYAKSPMSYEQAVANFKAIQCGTPVNINTIIRAENCKINKLIETVIDNTLEEKENIQAFEEFKKVYNEHGYHTLLVNACIYWNDEHNSRPNTIKKEIPKRVKSEVITENLEILFSRFAKFYKLITIKLDYIRTNLVMFKFVDAYKHNDPKIRKSKLLDIVKYIKNYSAADPVELGEDMGYYSHLLQMYN